MNEPDFYVGYQPRAPLRIGRLLRVTAAGLSLLAVAVAGLLIAGQAPFPTSRFDFGSETSYEGTLYEWPYPILATADSHYLLVAPGKHGADQVVRGLDGRAVKLRGQLIQRGADRMIELADGSLKATQVTPPARRELSLGLVSLAGEIVDTKCHFGVMNPGEGKVHRDCAARCISGGIPPGLLVHDATGASRVLLLVGQDGRKLNREILPYVGEPIRIQGELVRIGSAWALKASVANFHRD